MDGQKFHRIALDLAEAIEEKGWGQWELLPKEQLVSGIASIFYVIIYPAPWSVLPVNAFLNAFACVCMYLILAGLLENRPKGLIAALPFMFFPSNLLWNTQFHNENYAVPGVVFILYGWTLIARERENKTHISPLEAFSAITSIIVGSFLLGLVRVYILSGMSYLFILAGALLVVQWLFTENKTHQNMEKPILIVLACVLMVFTLYVINTNFPDSREDQSDTPKTNSSDRYPKWETTSWLPQAIDRQFKSLARYRNSLAASGSHAGSSIDIDITYKKADDVITYVPRAAQIAFLSPFPTMWFTQGRNDSGTAMRMVSAFEMIFVYLCFLGLPMFCWFIRGKNEAWLLILICTAMLIVYGLVVPNVGSLYRFRYPYLMPLVCFGWAGWILICKKHSKFTEWKMM